MDLELLILLSVPKVQVLINPSRNALISAGYASVHLCLQLICQLTPQHQLRKLILLHG